jgi:hypothetical protein
MSDESFDPYLWDRSGAPDAEVSRLESLLQRFRFDHRVTPPDADGPAESDEQSDDGGD